MNKLTIQNIINRIIIIILLLSTYCNCACPLADHFQCWASVCSTYNYANGNCASNSTTTCTVNTSVPTTTGCTTCSSLPSSTCSSTCVDWFYSTLNNICQNCASKYGNNCIQCTQSVCLSCAYSSNLVLASDSLSCITSNCTIANCL